MIRLVAILTVICVISALLLGFTYCITVDNIKQQEKNAENNALKAVIPAAKEFSPKISDKNIDYYKALDDKQQLIGYAFVAEGKGYSSVIKIMVGVDKDCVLQAIKILSQNETPGLGSKVDEIKINYTLWDKIKGKKIIQNEEPWFQAQFKTKPVDKVQIITGATITSKAVINAVKETLEKFAQQLKEKSL